MRASLQLLPAAAIAVAMLVGTTHAASTTANANTNTNASACYVKGDADDYRLFWMVTIVLELAAALFVSASQVSAGWDCRSSRLCSSIGAGPRIKRVVVWCVYVVCWYCGVLRYGVLRVACCNTRTAAFTSTQTRRRASAAHWASQS